MPRRRLPNVGPLVWHVMNRAVQNLRIFEYPDHYGAFISLLADAGERFPIALYAYCLMPNHWHLVVRSRSVSELSQYMFWLTTSHAQRWRVATETTGRGAVYQGRFKAVPVAEDGHFLRVCRYVESNPVRARLVASAEEWQWSSAARQGGGGDRCLTLAEWPVARPELWGQWLAVDQPFPELERIRRSVKLTVPYGGKEWADRALAPGSQCGRRKGRPRGARSPVSRN